MGGHQKVKCDPWNINEVMGPGAGAGTGFCCGTALWKGNSAFLSPGADLEMARNAGKLEFTAFVISCLCCSANSENYLLIGKPYT